MQAEKEEAELRVQDQMDQVNQANNTMEEFRHVNQTLQSQIDNLTDSNSAASLAASDQSNKRIGQKDELIKDLQNSVEELQKSEEAAKKLMSKMKVQNQDLVAKGR